MNKKEVSLAGRRAQIVARIAMQRDTLRQSTKPLRAPLARVDRGLEVLRYVRDRPALLVGIGLLILVLRPRPRSSWLGRGWILWQLAHSLGASKKLTARDIS